MHLSESLTEETQRALDLRREDAKKGELVQVKDSTYLCSEESLSQHQELMVLGAVADKADPTRVYAVGFVKKPKAN